MHIENSADQNAELTAAMVRIESLYMRAVRRQNPLKHRLTEGFSEALWKGDTLPYRDAAKVLRLAEREFNRVLASKCIATATETFTVRPRSTIRVMVMGGGGDRLRPGTIVKMRRDEFADFAAYAAA